MPEGPEKPASWVEERDQVPTEEAEDGWCSGIRSGNTGTQESGHRDTITQDIKVTREDVKLYFSVMSTIFQYLPIPGVMNAFTNEKRQNLTSVIIFGLKFRYFL